MDRRELPSYEIVDVVCGEGGFSRTKSFNDRIVDFVFRKANTSYAIDIPMPDNNVPSTFEIMESSGGTIYADAGCRLEWTPNIIVLKSTMADNTAKIRIMF